MRRLSAGRNEVDRDENRQEVLTVKQLVLIERPSTLPAVCAQVSGVRIRPAYETVRSLEASRLGPDSVVGVARDLVGHPSVRAMAGGTPQLPQVHQVSGRAAQARAQAQMVRTAASYGTNGTNGFRRDGIATAKQIVGDVSGAPPRGRPV
jgi:hypothetical protein